MEGGDVLAIKGQAKHNRTLPEEPVTHEERDVRFVSHESGPGTCSTDKSEAKGCEHGGVFWFALENSDIFQYFLE